MKKDSSKKLLESKDPMSEINYSLVQKSNQGKQLVTKKRLIRKKETQTMSLLEGSVNMEDNFKDEGRAQSHRCSFQNTFQLHLSSQLAA